MNVLGLTGGIDSIYSTSMLANTGLGHDSAALSLNSVGIISALEEERLSRLKHTNKFCFSAIRF
jgi:carbamoyltransferase